MAFESSETEAELLLESESSAGVSLVKKVGMALSLAGLLGATATFGVPKVARDFSTGFLQGKEERQKVTPSFAACSTFKDNCMSTGCCQVSGHKCFKVSETVGRCNETCTPGKNGWSCEEVSDPSVPVVAYPGDSLYCFSVYTKDTGSPKPSTELELLKLQRKFGASIFGCEGWDVFSDAAVPIDDSYTTQQVQDTFNEFHQIKRKETGAWVNWAIFYQVWVKVREVGRWKEQGFTVKVDPDAVFIPGRLRTWLVDKQETPHGVYYENCKNVQYGYFGNLEVMTHTATEVLTAFLEDCHEVFAPCANDGCDWEWGPWGEDVFAQRCMDHHYVDKVDAFDVTTDGACKADRPEDQKNNKKWHAEDCTQVSTAAVHPFKKPKDYFRCLGEIMQTTYEV